MKDRTTREKKTCNILNVEFISINLRPTDVYGYWEVDSNRRKIAREYVGHFELRQLVKMVVIGLFNIAALLMD